MKQMAQDALAASQAMKQMVQESLAASQLPKQPVDVKSELSTGMKPVDVKSEPSTGEPSLESTSIFVGSIPRDWTDEYIHAYLGGQARIIKRYHAEAKMGHAEVEVPKGHKLFDLDQEGVKLASKAGWRTDHTIRAAKWQSKAPAPAFASATKHRRSRRAKSEGKGTDMKERARFVAEFLAAVAPSSRRLYAQVASNTVEARMKSMAAAMNEMGKMVRCLMKQR